MGTNIYHLGLDYEEQKCTECGVTDEDDLLVHDEDDLLCTDCYFEKKSMEVTSADI